MSQNKVYCLIQFLTRNYFFFTIPLEEGLVGLNKNLCICINY